MTLTDAQALSAARHLWLQALHKDLRECSEDERVQAVMLVRALAGGIPDGYEPEAMFAVFLLWLGDPDPVN